MAFFERKGYCVLLGARSKQSINSQRTKVMYIDAGTGSMMLQVIAAGFFTAIVFFKNIRTYLKNLMSKSHVARENLEKQHEDRG